MSVDAPSSDNHQRKVSFAADAKPPGPAGPQAETKEQPKVDGVIGQLEVYRSGAIKMRLCNDIVMDVRLISILPSLMLTQCLGNWRNSAIVLAASCPCEHRKQTFACHGRSQQTVCCLTRLGYTSPCDGATRPSGGKRHVN